MDVNQKEYEAIILGALFHDIGKFVQRAQKNPRSKNHSQWGEEWFENILSEKLSFVFPDKEKDIVRGAIGNHHGHEAYVSLADAISAGMDRIPLDDEETKDPFTSRLVSVLSTVSIPNSSDANAPKQEGYHALSYLGKSNLKETFPVTDAQCSFREYSDLLTSLETELVGAKFVDVSASDIINYLYFILLKYTWCIPSAVYHNEPDVSLFDHLKTTASIASCLYLYRLHHPEETPSLKTQTFTLIGGDISGIQNYIFDVLTQQGKVAKRLRARSLYTQLVSEIAGHRIVRELNLPLCNLISAAGGNFYILAPNNQRTCDAIHELQQEFDNWLMENLGAELSISLALITLSGSDLKAFSAKLDSLKKNLNKEKCKPFKLSLIKEGAWDCESFIRPQVIPGDERVCQGCHKAPVIDIEGSDEKLCERCLNDTAIGQKIPKSRYLAFFADSRHQFKALNYSFELWDQETLDRKSSNKEAYFVVSLNRPEINTSVNGFKFLALHIPTKSDIPQANLQYTDQPVAFDDIAETSAGDKLLAYLKADVDRLGEILGSGFTLSKFTTFSRMLETFFSGYINFLLNHEYMRLYSVFSGGDDLFLVGPWNEGIDFAIDARIKFHEFCGGNKDLTFSAGITLAKPHDPLSFCTRMAEKQLEASKATKTKNSVTLFDQSMGWSQLEAVVREANKIIKWLEKRPPMISRGLVRNMMKYGAMAKASGILGDGTEVKTKYLRFVPYLAYDIKRNLAKSEQRLVYEWASDLLPTSAQPKGGGNLAFLQTIMHYVLTYKRS